MYAKANEHFKPEEGSAMEKKEENVHKEMILILRFLLAILYLNWMDHCKINGSSALRQCLPLVEQYAKHRYSAAEWNKVFLIKRNNERITLHKVICCAHHCTEHTTTNQSRAPFVGWHTIVIDWCLNFKHYSITISLCACGKCYVEWSHWIVVLRVPFKCRVQSSAISTNVGCPFEIATYTFIEWWAKLLESIAHIHYNLISSSDCAVESSKHYWRITGIVR